MRVIAVHPRVCGEQLIVMIGVNSSTGSSPRVRGTAEIPLRRPVASRFIPACAGNSWLSRLRCLWRSGSSPRVRGTAHDESSHLQTRRFIPACAGNSLSNSLRFITHPVHPRVCGEQIMANITIVYIAGSSPRVRGTVPFSYVDVLVCRFIPACAGNRVDQQ